MVGLGLLLDQMHTVTSLSNPGRSSGLFYRTDVWLHVVSRLQNSKFSHLTIVLLSLCMLLMLSQIRSPARMINAAAWTSHESQERDTIAERPKEIIKQGRIRPRRHGLRSVSMDARMLAPFLSLDPADIFSSHRNPFRQQRRTRGKRGENLTQRINKMEKKRELAQRNRTATLRCAMMYVHVLPYGSNHEPPVFFSFYCL